MMVVNRKNAEEKKRRTVMSKRAQLSLKEQLIKDAAKTEAVVVNACRCRICWANADRIGTRCFQCQANPNHLADLTTGIFSDMAYSPETEREG